MRSSKIKYSGAELLQRWRSSGLSQRKLAKRLNLNFNMMHGLIYRAQREEALVANDTVQVTQKGNYMKASGHSSRIKNEADFIRELEIDLDVWAIERLRIKTWEGYRKDIDKELEFDEGRITGFVTDHGGINTETLYSIEARLVKREPVEVKPAIRPVKLTIKGAKPPKGKRNKSGKTLNIADPHFGFSKDRRGNLTSFHDRKALSIVLSLAKDIKFDNIAIAGDLLDLAEWSTKFPRKVNLLGTTQPAIYEARWFLTQLRKLQPHAEIKLLEGNHDRRIRDYLIKHARYALELLPGTTFDGEGLMSIPNLLVLDDLDIEYVGEYPEGQVWIDNVLYVHGKYARAKSGVTAAATVQDAQYSTAFGHVHRREQATRTIHGPNGPEEITAFSPGCLCKIDGTVPGTPRPNWQQGFAVVIDREPELVPIRNERAMYNNVVYEAWDYLDSLKADVDWKF
jgi:hypothetical protein